MAPKVVKKAEPVPEPPAPPPVVETPVVEEVDNFDSVLSTLESWQKQLKTMIAVVKSLKKKNDKLEKQSVRKTSKKAGSAQRAPSGFAKEALLSNELSDFLGVAHGTKMSRMDVTSKVNEYIKKNNLQDTKDKRNINPDAKLGKILSLGKDDKLTYFNLQKFMKHHYKKVE